MHSGSGDGMHAPEEYVETESVEKLAEIQIAFLEKLALAKAK
jgi:di/tripeptidase